MRDILGRVSIISGVSAIAATILLGLIVVSVMGGTPDRAALDEGVQPAKEGQSSDRVTEEAQPEKEKVQPEKEKLDGALELLGQVRAEESTAFQAYNNALYEQKQLEEEVGQLEADLVVAEQPTDELEVKRQQLIETADEAIARKERFENAEAEKQAYLDSLSSELRAQIQVEQERRAEEARAAAAEVREEVASEASDPATTPPQLIQKAEAEVPQVEETLEPQPVQIEEPEAQPELQAAEVEEAPGLQRDPQTQQEERAAAAELAEQELAEEQAAAEQYAAEQEAATQQVADLQYEGEAVPDQQPETLPTEESDSPPSEVANAVVAEAASFIGTQAVDEDATAAPETVAAQQEPVPAGANAEQYQPQQDVNTEELQSSSETEAQAADENSTAAPVTSSGQAVVDEGANYTGTPYLLGGVPECVPYETMDCSCLTMTVYAAFGIYLPDSPEAQMGYGTPVSGEPQAGDLVFWSEDGSGIITHVGIATGKGTTVHASGFAGYVTETPIEYIPGYVGARRLL